MPTNAAFGVDAASVTVTKGSASGNFSTVTVTPVNGFTGAVNLTASLVVSPAGAQSLPGLSFTTSSVNIAGQLPATAKLVIQTVGSTAVADSGPQFRLTGAGGAALGCLLFLFAPVRRRSWAKVVGMSVLLAAALSGLSACSGSVAANSTGNSGNGGSNAGTTPGQYTIAVTATAGSLTATKTITLTVQ